MLHNSVVNEVLLVLKKHIVSKTSRNSVIKMDCIIHKSNPFYTSYKILHASILEKCIQRQCWNLPSLSSPKFPLPIFLPTRKLGPTIIIFVPVPLPGCLEDWAAQSLILAVLCLHPSGSEAFVRTTSTAVVIVDNRSLTASEDNYLAGLVSNPNAMRRR